MISVKCQVPLGRRSKESDLSTNCFSRVSKLKKDKLRDLFKQIVVKQCFNPASPSIVFYRIIIKKLRMFVVKFRTNVSEYNFLNFLVETKKYTILYFISTRSRSRVSEEIYLLQLFKGTISINFGTLFRSKIETAAMQLRFQNTESESWHCEMQRYSA